MYEASRHGGRAYKHLSELLASAKAEHKQSVTWRDHEESWRAFKGRGLERIIKYVEHLDPLTKADPVTNGKVKGTTWKNNNSLEHFSPNIPCRIVPYTAREPSSYNKVRFLSGLVSAGNHALTNGDNENLWEVAIFGWTPDYDADSTARIAAVLAPYTGLTDALVIPQKDPTALKLKAIVDDLIASRQTVASAETKASRMTLEVNETPRLSEDDTATPVVPIQSVSDEVVDADALDEADEASYDEWLAAQCEGMEVDDEADDATDDDEVTELDGRVPADQEPSAPPPSVIEQPEPTSLGDNTPPSLEPLAPRPARKLPYSTTYFVTDYQGTQLERRRDFYDPSGKPTKAIQWLDKPKEIGRSAKDSFTIQRPKASDCEVLVFVEGEKTADRVKEVLPAPTYSVIGILGTSGCPNKDTLKATHYTGAQQVVLLADNDAPGFSLMRLLKVGLGKAQECKYYYTLGKQLRPDRPKSDYADDDITDAEILDAVERARTEVTFLLSSVPDATNKIKAPRSYPRQSRYGFASSVRRER